MRIGPLTTAVARSWSRSWSQSWSQSWFRTRSTPQTSCKRRAIATMTTTNNDELLPPPVPLPPVAPPMTPAKALLSDLTIYAKYARFHEAEGRREVWDEIVERNVAMHAKKFPALADEIKDTFQLVKSKRVLPSMRSLQFAGKALETNNARMFNCAYLPITAPRDFAEILFLLLGGTGVGFSVQHHHIAQLPAVVAPDKSLATKVHAIEDSIEGWAEAVHDLVTTYLSSAPQPPVEFDYSLIRPEGAPLVTAGGRAPGPDGLRKSLQEIEAIFSRNAEQSACSAEPHRLPAIDVHDIICHVSTCVASGGIRRSALISLFSPDDEAMLAAKAGAWWEGNQQRAMANNSAVLDRSTVDKDTFFGLWEKIEASGSGEPGMYLTNSPDWGTNPCCEIALEPYQFCNLAEIDVSRVVDQADLNALTKAAAFIGTLQASYTDFHFLRPKWRETTEAGALIGVSMTGIASGRVMHLDLSEAAECAVEENKRVAALVGVKPAHRITTVKPAGTTSLVLATSSGVHPWHAKYYVRRMRFSKKEPIYQYLAANNPELLEDDVFNPEKTAVMSFPQKAPEGAILRDESAINLLERVKAIHQKWLQPGHQHGENKNNVSTTISLHPHEWAEVGEWMWENMDSWNGLCVLPFAEHTYKQAPFEEIDEAEFTRLSALVRGIDLTKVAEDMDITALQAEIACAGNKCEVVHLTSTPSS